MAARNGRKKQLSESNLILLTAVKKVTGIQKGSGLTERQTHCRFHSGYVMATNDVMLIGTPADGLAIECCPHSKTLVAALERCEGETTFTLEGNTLTVKSGRVRVPVPCLPVEALADLCPDERQGDAGAALAVALGMASAIVDETAQNPMCRAVFVGPGTVEALHDAKVAIQVWHGVSPLPVVCMPKESALAVSKNPAVLTGLGVSNGSATFWFDDNSYIRSCLYDVKRPDFNKLMECQTTAPEKKIEPEFFEAVKSMLPFSETSLDATSHGAVTFAEGKVWAGVYAHDGAASLDYPFSPIEDATLNGNYVLMFSIIGKTLVYDSFQRKLYINGDSMRAVIMGMRKRGD